MITKLGVTLGQLIPGTCKAWLYRSDADRRNDRFVIAWREVNVAQHLSAVGTFALDANCEGGTLSLPTQDRAKTKRRVDLVSGYRHPCRIRPITRARRVFRVRSGSRLLPTPVLRTARALQYTTFWPQSSFFTVSNGFH